MKAFVSLLLGCGLTLGWISLMGRYTNKRLRDLLVLHPELNESEKLERFETACWTLATPIYITVTPITVTTASLLHSHAWGVYTMICLPLLGMWAFAVISSDARDIVFDGNMRNGTFSALFRPLTNRLARSASTRSRNDKRTPNVEPDIPK